MADSNGTKVSSAEKVQKDVGRPKDKITELNLDNCRSNNILSLLEEHPALEALSLINAGLVSLKGFPKLTNLKKLRLSDNRIADGLNYLSNSPKLQNLDLSGNKIKELEVLEALQDFKQLSTLDLFNNEVTQVENYREKLFKMLPSLEYLDGMDSKNVAAPSDDEDDEEFNGNDSEDDADSEEDLDEDDDDDDDDSVEGEDMSLAEIYNEDLEEDNSDWEGEGGEDDDDDIDSDEDEDGEANKSTTSAAAAKGAQKKVAAEDDSQPTNKKKKTSE